MAWFDDNDVRVLSWPGNSPNLNMMESLWRNMKKKINYGACKSLPSLRQEVTRVCCLETTREVCANLVESMPRRIAQVIKNCGCPTKYCPPKDKPLNFVCGSPQFFKFDVRKVHCIVYKMFKAVLKVIQQL